MGNVNNCLINNIRFDELNIKQDRNIPQDKEINNSNYNNINNKYKLEPAIQENTYQNENIPKDNYSKGTYNRNEKNMLKISPSNSFNISENQKNINFNNIRYNNGILLENNIFFNATRKSNPIKKSFEKYQINENKLIKNNFSQDNVNFSENNYGSNKVINTEEESDNLIILDYNNQKDNIEKKIDVNNINGYKNDDGLNLLNKINNDKKDENIINNNKNLNSDAINNIALRMNNNSTKAENKDDINELTQKSDKTVKNDFIETTNIFKNNIPYSKPSLFKT